MTKNPKANMIPLDFSMPGMPADNVVESDHHVLISEVQPAEMNPLVEDGMQIPGIFEEVPANTLHKLFIGDFMENGKGLVKIINKLQMAPREDQLEFHISSYGGSFAEVVMVHNLIDSMFKSRSVSYLNHGYSGGAMAFVMCPERIVYEHSVAMFHFFSGGERGKGSDMLNSLEHSMKTIGGYYRKMLTPYFSQEELDLMIHNGKEYWFDAVEMLERDIATGIIMSGQYYTKDEYFTKFNEDGDIKPEFQEQTQIELQKSIAIEEFAADAYGKTAKEVEKFTVDYDKPVRKPRKPRKPVVKKAVVKKD